MIGGDGRLGGAGRRESMVQAFRRAVGAQRKNSELGTRDRVWRKKSAGGDGGREGSIGVDMKGTSNEQKV